MDLIDRKALIKQTVEKFYTTNYFKHITEMIDDAPTVDAVPLSVIEEIKAEINELPSYVARFNGGDFAIHIDKEKVLKIIDEKAKEYTDGNNDRSREAEI